MDLSQKRVLVVGLGVSGVAAARLALRRGAHVVAYDSKPATALGEVPATLAQEGATLLLGHELSIDPNDTDLVVVSPGVPPLPALNAAVRAGVTVMGELELAYQCFEHPASIVAVGGTNGKSTTTSLIGSILTETGARTFVGGNLGDPFADAVDSPYAFAVLEVSSFQLERLELFRPRVSILLNITPDHLDRYADFDAYARAKGNAFARQQSDDVAVVPVGDALCLREARRGAARIVTFGVGGDVEILDEVIRDRLRGHEFPRREIHLQGGHNAANVAASIAAVSVLDVPYDRIRSALASFRGLSHRTAFVGSVNGARYYDDSKGTNVGATVAALTTLAEPKAVLVAGGRDKGGSYAPLAEALRAKGRCVVVIGEAADAIASAVAGVVPVFRAGTMDEAVRLAAREAKPGDAVLLSPACSSYDMFRDYKHRGDEFVAAVNRLQGRGAAP